VQSVRIRPQMRLVCRQADCWTRRTFIRASQFPVSLSAVSEARASKMRAHKCPVLPYLAPDCRYKPSPWPRFRPEAIPYYLAKNRTSARPSRLPPAAQVHPIAELDRWTKKSPTTTPILWTNKTTKWSISASSWSKQRQKTASCGQR
jgi:hypothetical protein